MISSDVARRLARLPQLRFDGGPPIAVPARLDVEDARHVVVRRWGADLCGLLNAMTRDELAAACRALRVDSPSDAKSPKLRELVWAAGAELERGGLREVPPALQPRPRTLGGHLVICAPTRGLAPPAARYPREVPPPVAAQPPEDEPETLDELLAAADRLVGVRLGPRGRDKGAWGMRASRLLGLVERGHDEPDWRGDVEVKTVPVSRDREGAWAVVEDPAIAMLGERGLAKLQRTLWLARATLSDGAGDPDATIVTWYLLEWDADIARLARRYLHDRPKGPRGTTARGLYLHKRFFADAGLLACLNGASA